MKCLSEFPRTNFHLDPDNEVAKLFWGRIKVQNAASFFYYQKGSRYQNLIHEMKYYNQKQLGQNIGRWFGSELLHTPFCSADIVHPVPLHYTRQKVRGYNQSEQVAMGIAEVLGIPLEIAAIERAINTGTQTRRSKYDRWSNVEGIFRVVKPEKLRNRHILLVDDVVTTGSTLEACATPLLALEGTAVSILTLGCVKIQ